MSENIKASEISDVLRMQLEGIDTDLRFEEVGTVLQVSDGVVRIYRMLRPTNCWSSTTASGPW